MLIKIFVIFRILSCCVYNLGFHRHFITFCRNFCLVDENLSILAVIFVILMKIPEL